MVDEPGRRPPARHGHRERVDDEVGLEVVAHRPADDLTAEHVHHHAEEQMALERRHVRDVGKPKGVRAIGAELALDQVGRRRGLLVSDRCPPLGATPGDAPKAELAHQPCDALPTHMVWGKETRFARAALFGGVGCMRRRRRP
jgi:hypothetical protein